MSKERNRFTEKVAIITGGASGIGLATAKLLGSEGARVIIAGLDQKKCDAAAAEVLKAGAPDAAGIVCDVSDEKQVTACVDETFKRFGEWNVVVNSAGLMTFKALEDLTSDDWTRILKVDLLGAFYFTREAFKRMEKGGAIVNVSSIHAEETTPGVAPYAAAKAALVSLTRSAAIEGKPKGLRANAILPGAVDTPMLWDNPNVKAGLEHIDRSDVGTPEDIAEAIAFLASDDAEFVQGDSMRVDGGRLTHL